jgi:hypothetical protein
LVAPAFALFLHYHRKTFRQGVERFYSYAVKHGKVIDTHSANAVYHLRSRSFNKLLNKFYRLKLRFPEQHFNRVMKQKFQLLAKIMTKGISLVSIGSADGVVEVYSSLLDAYRRFIEEINRVEPKRKGKAFVDSFKKSMEGIIQALSNKRQELEGQAKRLVEQHDILSTHNRSFYYELDQTIRYSSLFQGLLMDRGGER